MVGPGDEDPLFRVWEFYLISKSCDEASESGENVSWGYAKFVVEWRK